MIIKQTVHLKKEIVTGCICDCCRREFDSDDIKTDDKRGSFFLGGRTISGTYGYGSPLDGDNYSIDLCDLCLENMISNIKKKEIKKE